MKIFFYFCGDNFFNLLAPLPPTKFTVVSFDNNLVNLTWISPNEVGRGQTIAYELGYRIDESECDVFQTLGLQIDCENEKVRNKMVG